MHVCDVLVSISRLSSLPLELSEALRTASFDCSPLSDAEILALLEFMFVDFGLPEAFNFERSTLRSFLYEVYKNYNEVPFHNFRHGFCVTQMVSCLRLSLSVTRKSVSSRSRVGVAVMLAAFGLWRGNAGGDWSAAGLGGGNEVLPTWQSFQRSNFLFTMVYIVLHDAKSCEKGSYGNISSV